MSLASSWLGMAQASLGGAPQPVWPSLGVALAGLYLLGLSRWPAVFVASLGVHLLSASPSMALSLAAGHTLEAVLGVWLLRRLGFSAGKARPQEVLVLVCTATVSTLVGLPSGVWLLASRAELSWEAVGALAWRGWEGSTLAVLGAGVALMLLARRKPETLWREGLALMGLLLGVCLWSFSVSLRGSSLVYVQVLVLFPVGVWAALRFGSPGAALSLVLLVAVSMLSALVASGAFAPGEVARSAGLPGFKLFLALATGVGLLWRAVHRDQAAAQTRLEALTTVVRNVREGVVICEKRPGEGPRIVFLNPFFQEMCGWTQEELAGCSPWEFCDFSSSQDVQKRVEDTLREKGEFRGEVVLVHKDGSRLFSQMHLACIPSGSGEVSYVVGTHHDLTVQRQLQEKLVSAGRIAAVGTLAAGVGHEINNPLAYLLLNLEGVARSLRQGPEHLAEARTRLDSVREGAERIRVIVRDLKVFSRQEGEEREMLDVNAVVVPAMRMAAHAVRARARLVEDFGSPPPVLGCEARLGQVLLNLIINALQAIPEGNPERHEVRVRTGGDGLGRALVEVSDTGCGMSPAVLARIFEPFFTTKPADEGTGLGLSICQQIVQSHGGELRVRSEPGKGSVFTLVLPAATQTSPTPAEPEPAVAESAPRRRILIIDDEPRLAQSMRMLIEPSHDVVITTRGAEALAWVSAGQRFDLVLCDLQMPGTTGMDVYSHLRAHAPELLERLVFISGGAYTQSMRDFVRTVRNRVLEKPVRPHDLLATIDEALATSSAA